MPSPRPVSGRGEALTGIRDWHWLAGFLAAGLAVAAAWTLLTVAPALRACTGDRPPLRAQGAGLQHAGNERDRSPERGRAGPHRRRARLRRTGVLEQFPVCFPWHPAAAAAGPAAARPCSLVAGQKQGPTATEPPATQPPPEVKKSAEDLRQKLADAARRPEKAGLKDATDLLKKIRRGDQRIEVAERSRKGPREAQSTSPANFRSGESSWAATASRSSGRMEQIQNIEKAPPTNLGKPWRRAISRRPKRTQQLQKKLRAEARPRQEERTSQADGANQAEARRAGQEREAGPGRHAAAANQSKRKATPPRPTSWKTKSKLQQKGPQMDSLCRALQQARAVREPDEARQRQPGLADDAASHEQMQELARQQSELKDARWCRYIADARRQMNCDKCGGKGCKECQGRGRRRNDGDGPGQRRQEG